MVRSNRIGQHETKLDLKWFASSQRNLLVITNVIMDYRFNLQMLLSDNLCHSQCKQFFVKTVSFNWWDRPGHMQATWLLHNCVTLVRLCKTSDFNVLQHVMLPTSKLSSAIYDSQVAIDSVTRDKHKEIQVIENSAIFHKKSELWMHSGTGEWSHPDSRKCGDKKAKRHGLALTVQSDWIPVVSIVQ